MKLHVAWAESDGKRRQGRRRKNAPRPQGPGMSPGMPGMPGGMAGMTGMTGMTGMAGMTGTGHKSGP